MTADDHVSDQEGGGGVSQFELPPEDKLWLDPWLTSRHSAVTAFVALVHNAYDKATVRRAHSARQRADIEAAARIIGSNLARACVVAMDRPGVALSFRSARQKRNRYEGPLTRSIVSVITFVSSRNGRDAAVRLHRSRKLGVASWIEPVGRLPTLFENMRETDFERLPGGETIWLRSKSQGLMGRTETGPPIDYPETGETTRMREEMARINAQLASAQLELGGAQQPPSQLRRMFATNDPGEVRFDLGGRLFGGWWQSLPRAQRHDLTVAGEPVCDLDFPNMFLRLAYHQAGSEPPEGDLYGGVWGLSEPQWRDGVKRIVAALLFRQTPLQKLPKGMAAKLPEGMTGKAARDAIVERHPLLSGVFETGIGFRLMFLESEILVTALVRLADQNIVGLPMHDGMMVQRSAEAAARDAMGFSCEKILGRRLSILSK